MKTAPVRQIPEVASEEEAALAVPAVEVQEVAVVEGPDPVGVAGVLQEDRGAQALQGVRDLPGEAVEEEIAGAGGLGFPEIEEEGGPRILPPPEPLPGLGFEKRAGGRGESKAPPACE